MYFLNKKPRKQAEMNHDGINSRKPFQVPAPSSTPRTNRQDTTDFETKLLKTTLVMCAVNVVSSVLCATTDDSSLSALGMIIINAACLQMLHDIGKSRRFGTNMLFNAKNAFSAPDERLQLEAQNALKNIINGGAHVADESMRRLA